MDLDWGDLRRLQPVSRAFGYDRGTPVDRYYIDQFLRARSHDIAGHVLEIGDDTYTRAFGGSRVTRRDILHVHSRNPKATIISDLTGGEGIPSNAFDCAIVTQTLHMIGRPETAMHTLFRILKPGGVLLATIPGISPLSSDEWNATWHWAFTLRSAREIAAGAFGPGNVEIGAHGNLFAATCFLQGAAVEDITAAELDVRDPDCDVLITVRAKKAVSV